ncbi:hypothetical protein TWF481_012070 [Arthrobotrys musiformis]|uniref:Uncharacterized protein n=1 Tax=Arthrobotrys musiformis TaxID=47236 RepID=A0AAV9VYF8_9PEZI
MPNVTFSVGSPLAYNIRSLELPGKVHKIKVTFEHGENVFTSPDFELGTTHSTGSAGVPLLGRLVFSYTYNCENKSVTLCSTDYPSGDGMKLLTFPKDTTDICVEHSADVGFPADEGFSGGLWNYQSNLMPGAAQIFKGITRNASDSLITALRSDPKLIVQLRALPAELSIESALALSQVYRDGEYVEMYDHTKVYGPEFSILGYGSVLNNPPTAVLAGNFANVLGSTGDRKINGWAWLELWERQVNGGNPATDCASKHYNGFQCNNVGRYNLVGGHVVIGNAARPGTIGGNDVYIIPICDAHNKYTFIGPMAPVIYSQAVWLNNYHNP